MRNDELTNIDIVLYALFRLGGYKHKVHTEEIAEIEIRDEDFGSFRARWASDVKRPRNQSG